ncbi:DNA-methyltransferase [Mammaliicoccus vitulinus]|uniref:DNA-methyltransferase n=1 Tax=Mammaliicoccus vitulinus TaxID=71237 RepID=UPI00248ACC92|nr:site-specific DNA-methyltransferase [Mammaliicoccus vitulinus]
MFELNKIYLGDAYELIKEIPDKSIDLIVTDPPYQFQSGGGGGAFGSKKRSYHSEYYSLSNKYEFKERYSSRLDKDKVKNRKEIAHLSTGFDYKILDEFVRVLKKMNIYIWCSKAQVRKLLDYFEDKGYAIDILTWHKDNPIPTANNSYLSDTEYCIFAKETGAYLGGSYETKRKFYVTHTNRQDKNNYHHPTIKPLNIIKNLIINSSKGGGIILDPFIGSGTTAVACKELNRNFIGFEINEEYFKIANDRLNGITQKEKKQGVKQLSLFDDKQ